MPEIEVVAAAAGGGGNARPTAKAKALLKGLGLDASVIPVSGDRLVNPGFTVQAGETHYLTVVRDAASLETKPFIEALGEVQRNAIQRKLSRDVTTGATIAFSSMARWNVSRHIPILPPYCSLMIAHAAPKGSGRAVPGASYDHRVLSGFDVARLLMELAKPPV